MWNVDCRWESAEVFVVRLMIVGGSLLLEWIVRHQVSPEVEVEHVRTLDQARERFRDRAPDAVLLSVRPGPGQWREVAGWCHGHHPPIPTLIHAGAHLDPAEAGIELDNRSFFTESLGPADLDRLIHAANEARAAVADP